MQNYLNSLISGGGSKFGTSVVDNYNSMPAPTYGPAVPSSPSATSTSGTPTYGPANPAIKSAPAQTYINSLTPDQKASNNAMTQSGNYTFGNGSTASVVNGKVTSPVVSTNPTAPTNLGYGNSTTNTSTGTGSNSSNPVSPTAQGAYSQYLASKIAADKSLSDIQQAQDTQSENAREEQDTILHTPGGTTAGAEQGASIASRNANNTAAALALQENAAARSAGVADTAYTDAQNSSKPIAVGDQLYQLQPDGTYKSVAGTQKLDTSTVEVNGNKELINNQTGAVIKNLGSATAPSNSNATYIPGANPVADSYIAGILNGNITSIASVPAQYRDQVALGLNDQPAAAYSPLAASRNTLSATRIAAHFIDLPQYQLTANGVPYLQRIDAALQNPGSVSDQDLLDSLTKLDTGGNAISDAQVKVITDGKSLSDWADTLTNKLGNGGVLSDSQRQQISKLAKATFSNYQKGYQPVYDQVTAQFKAAGIPKAFWTIPDLNNLNEQAQDGSPLNGSAPQIPKGNLGDSSFVATSLEKQGLSYQDIISNVPSGQKAVMDNSNGQVGYIPTSEFDPSIYTSL